MREGYDSYFGQLTNRLPISYWYRYGWLYPRLSPYLQGRVLDVGCGLGDMVHYRPGTVGVDVNLKAVEYCRARGLDVRAMEPDLLPFEGSSFDGVVLDNVLEHLEHPEPLLSEIRRLLRPQGVCVVGVPGRRGYAWDPDHKRFYDEAGLNACLARAGFSGKRVIHTPFRSSWLDARLRIYALYGVYGLA